MQDISWNGGALPRPTKYPAYSKKTLNKNENQSKQKKKIKNKKEAYGKYVSMKM